jgi:hypothetical protein
MGPSLPLRSNGIFSHKALWGCRAGRRKRVFPGWIFLADRLTDEKRNYLNDLGLIVEEKGCYYGLILLSEGETPSEDRKLEDHEEALRDGLEGVRYLSAPQRSR